jgi:hypothetical protein
VRNTSENFNNTKEAIMKSNAPKMKEFLANFLKDKPNLSGTKEEYDMAIGACDTRQLKGTCKGCDCIEDCYANRYKPI